MKSSTRNISNIYWSWRDYLKTSFPSIKKYYNPASQPKPADVNTWIIFLTGFYDPDLFTISIPEIHCVAKEDADGSNMIDLVTSVMNKVDNESTGRRSIPFYDKATETRIGDIWVDKTVSHIETAYDTGISSRLITIHTTIKTARKLRRF